MLKCNVDHTINTGDQNHRLALIDLQSDSDQRKELKVEGRAIVFNKSPQIKAKLHLC